jgi:hypothetical protein
LKEQDEPSIDGTNYQVIKTPAGKFKIGVVSPEDGKLYDAAQFFGGGTFWQKEYMSQPEAQAAIRSLNPPKNGEMMEEAYDAKGVEEAKDKKTKGKRWQDNDGDGKWYEKGDDVSEDAKPDYIDADKDGDKTEPMKKAVADKKKKDSVDEGAMCESCNCQPCECGDSTDESVLNMRESFWGRVKGNLKGHEYILREAFRK